MNNCEFNSTPDGYFKCTESGWIHPVKMANSPRGRCPVCQGCKQSRSTPLTPEQNAERQHQHAEDIAEAEKLGWTTADAKHWVQAIRKWRQAGKPKRTDAEVIAILEICETCDEYHTNEQRCGKCRCCVSRRGMAVFNKARLATETCPLGLWPQAQTK